MTLILTEWKKQEDGGWVVQVYGLPGCITQGKDEREARLNAIECYLMFQDSMEDEGLPMPWDQSFERVWPDSELRWVRIEHSEKVERGI